MVREHEEFVWLHDRYVENEEYAGIIVSIKSNIDRFLINHLAKSSFDQKALVSRLSEIDLCYYYAMQPCMLHVCNQ